MENDIDRVKRKLWSFGYQCKGVSDIPGLDYDLLVEQKYQVRVVNKLEDIDSVPKGIIVARIEGEEITYHICSRGVCREESSPLKAFPKVENQEA